MRVHLDTDFAGDTDDAAALALLLGWPDVEVVGITTVADPDGRRAGYARHFLRIAGCSDIAVAAGAGASLAGKAMGGLPDHTAYWGDAAAVDPVPSPQGAAVELLAASVERGATIIGIGPFTNLALLDRTRPGTLDTANVVLMGGSVQAPAAGLPPWGPEMDWNVQCDTAAMVEVFDAAGTLTLATLQATLEAHLRAAHLGRLEASGPLGRLLARQARAHGAEHNMSALGRDYAGLPDDLLNFQYDPIACAVAAGWPGATIETMNLRPAIDDDVLRFERAAEGKPVAVVVAVDGDAFAETWLTAVERVDQIRSD